MIPLDSKAGKFDVFFDGFHINRSSVLLGSCKIRAIGIPNRSSPYVCAALTISRGDEDYTNERSKPSLPALEVCADNCLFAVVKHCVSDTASAMEIQGVHQSSQEDGCNDPRRLHNNSEWAWVSSRLRSWNGEESSPQRSLSL